MRKKHRLMQKKLDDIVAERVNDNEAIRKLQIEKRQLLHELDRFKSDISSKTSSRVPSRARYVSYSALNPDDTFLGVAFDGDRM